MFRRQKKNEKKQHKFQSIYTLKDKILKSKPKLRPNKKGIESRYFLNFLSSTSNFQLSSTQ